MNVPTDSAAELSSGRAKTIVAIGEVLWDVFPDGARFGGAPANFACSIAELSGAAVASHMISAVGDDSLGKQAVDALRSHGVHTACVQTRDEVTGQVHVRLDENGVASYEFATNTAWDNLVWNDALDQLAANTDVVCFGSLGQRSETSRQTIVRFVETAEAKFRICDINLRAPYYCDAVICESIALCNVLKLNDDELPIVCDLLGIYGTAQQQLQGLAERFSLKAIALTRGANGALIMRGEDVSEIEGVKANVVDTVGAGDAFTASLTIGLLQNANLTAINRFACEVAAYVCTQHGATPQIPRERFRLPT